MRKDTYENQKFIPFTLDKDFLRFSYIGAEVNEEIKLVDFLLANYSKQARPVINSNKAINTTFGVEIVHLIKVVSSKSTHWRRGIQNSRTTTQR